VNLGIDSAWEKAALDLLDPGQLDSCSYQGSGYKGEMKLSKVLRTICSGTAQGLRLYVTKQFNEKMLFNHIFSFRFWLGRTGLL